MKLIVIFLVSIFNAHALPLLKGEVVQQKINGEYLVRGEISDKNKIEKTLGQNFYLVKADKLNSFKTIIAVYPNYRYLGNPMESEIMDPLFEKQFHHKMIGSEVAWKTTYGNDELIIAVTDNEFELQHEDLKDSWWKNINEIPDNGIDDDQNGYIDDVYGWDFIDGDNNVVARKEITHGTHISGTIAAQKNNIGVIGVAPNLKVMPLRWFSSENSTGWTTALIIETYNYAYEMGAKIISTSYGIDALVEDEAYRELVKDLTSKGILIVNSAGNAGKKDPPRGEIDELILVCSVKSKDADNQDKKSSFSNYGKGIDICAPGDPVYATVHSTYSDATDRYGISMGTSMSAPIVAASLGLIWSAFPELSADEVKNKLYENAKNIDDRNWFWVRGKLGHGRVDLKKVFK